MTLLRTVRDVLEKIDGPAGTRETRRKIDAGRKSLFAKEPEPRIYHEFIEDERNNVVHVYEVSARVDVTVRLGDQGPATCDFVMRDGPYKGRDPRELAAEAIDFWRDYLDKIESP